MPAVKMFIQMNMLGEDLWYLHEELSARRELIKAKYRVKGLKMRLATMMISFKLSQIRLSSDFTSLSSLIFE